MQWSDQDCRGSVLVDADLLQQNASNRVLQLPRVIISRPHTKKILIGNVYRPPDGEAFVQLSSALAQIQNVDKYEMPLIGEFNADDSMKRQLPVRIMRQFASEYELLQMIDEPTRSTRSKKSTIDLDFTNIKYCTSAGVLNYNISDHRPIYIVQQQQNKELQKDYLPLGMHLLKLSI